MDVGSEDSGVFDAGTPDVVMPSDVATADAADRSGRLLSACACRVQGGSSPTPWRRLSLLLVLSAAVARRRSARGGTGDERHSPHYGSMPPASHTDVPASCSTEHECAKPKLPHTAMAGREPAWMQENLPPQ